MGAEVQERMSEQIAQFSKLPESCDACNAEFDKQNKEMVQSWYVIVREEKGQVNLYCPECWSRATGIVKQLKEEMNEEKS